MNIVAWRMAPYFAFVILAAGIALMAVPGISSWSDIIVACIDHCIMVASDVSRGSSSVH